MKSSMSTYYLIGEAETEKILCVETYETAHGYEDEYFFSNMLEIACKYRTYDDAKKRISLLSKSITEGKKITIIKADEKIDFTVFYKI